MSRRQAQFAAVSLAASALAIVSAPLVQAGSPPTAMGSIAGIVRDEAGFPRAGALVLLMNRYERIIERAATNEKGIFGFTDLSADAYAVRISLPSFVPALKQKIAVQPGMQSLLFVSMASLVSSVELVYALPGQGALISDDWKWTLKASTATRPILRFRSDSADGSSENRSEAAIFSDTLGMIRISAGDSEGAGTAIASSDLGTAFALATSVFGRSRLQLSANFGYAARTGLPQGGIRTSFSRTDSTPELSITLRELYLPTRPVSTQPDGAPALRTITLAMNDHLDVFPGLRLDYGMSFDSISYMDRLTYASPYGRLTYELGALGAIRLAFSSGAPPVGLYSQSQEGELQLLQDLAALAAVPVLSLRNERARVQRTHNLEIGYQKRIGTRTVHLSGYHESISDLALLAYAPGGLLPSGDLLPDFSSSSSIFNAGSFERFGYAASLTQSLGDHLEVGTSYGSTGVLSMNTSQPVGAIVTGDSALDLRSRFHTSNHRWASARIAANLPVSGTQITASYQWTDPGAIILEHFDMTQGGYPQPGCNILVRQPLPAFFGMPGHLEATAELQNLLAQGYVSLPTTGGQHVVLTQVPRAVRGGLSFVF